LLVYSALATIAGFVIATVARSEENHRTSWPKP
jgi:hypothetical protein